MNHIHLAPFLVENQATRKTYTMSVWRHAYGLSVCLCSLYEVISFRGNFGNLRGRWTTQNSLMTKSEGPLPTRSVPARQNIDVDYCIEAWNVVDLTDLARTDQCVYFI